MDITHSCCPGKTNIYAPMFELTQTLNLARGTMHEWTCKGCKTVIYVTKLSGTDVAAVPSKTE